MRTTLPTAQGGVLHLFVVYGYQVVEEDAEKLQLTDKLLQAVLAEAHTLGQLSIEFVNVGGWLTSGDLALDSCAQFLAIAEHRLIPSRARSVGHLLRKAGYQSVWAPACQDEVAGGHAGVGVVSLGGALLSLPSFCYSSA